MQDRLSTGSVSPSKPVVNELCRSILRDYGKCVSAVLENVVGTTLARSNPASSVQVRRAVTRAVTKLARIGRPRRA